MNQTPNGLQSKESILLSLCVPKHIRRHISTDAEAVELYNIVTKIVRLGVNRESFYCCLSQSGYKISDAIALLQTKYKRDCSFLNDSPLFVSITPKPPTVKREKPKQLPKKKKPIKKFRPKKAPKDTPTPNKSDPSFWAIPTRANSMVRHSNESRFRGGRFRAF